MSGTDFLYPFIERAERDAGPLLADLAASAVAKAETSARLRTSTLAESAPALTAAAGAMADQFLDGQRRDQGQALGRCRTVGVVAAIFELFAVRCAGERLNGRVVSGH